MKQHISDLLISEGFYSGRMLSANKKAPKDHICVWNANVIVESIGKLWFGDINLNTDTDKLKFIAKQIGEPLYVLKEMDARFGTEDLHVSELIKKAVWSTKE